MGLRGHRHHGSKREGHGDKPPVGIEGIGLSHGHYDHCGGLMAVLEASGPKKVFVHPDAFTPRYAIFGQVKRFIGIPFSKAAIEGASLGLELSRSRRGDARCSLRVKSHGSPISKALSRTCSASWTGYGSRPFPDDQALVVIHPKARSCLTGCAHSGVVNILKHVLESRKRISAVVGGTHLGLGDAKRLQPTIDFLDEVAPDKMIFTHCTGAKAAAAMMERFKEGLCRARQDWSSACEFKGLPVTSEAGSPPG